MLARCGHFGDAAKSLVAGFWITLGVCSVVVRGQEGDGCGHTVMGTESGTLASQNYPGTYPSNTWCKWRLLVPEGRTLQLLFGDFDIESSPGCGNGSLVITDKSGEPSLGPVCGKLDASQTNVTLKSNEVIITFKSGPHRSGRGFLLSYATDQYPDLISCLRRGSHFSSQHLSVYCPAGCKNVTGDVWGNSEHGYRDTSVLCKSAVHAGAASDYMGGRVTVTRGRSLKLYEPTFANGILSKMGSLSEKKLLFSQECNNILPISGYNASSFWDKNSQEHRALWSSRNMDSSHEFLLWAADSGDRNPWVELELSDRSTITGCQSFQAKTLPCPQSQLISYPLERNVHDALPSPPLNDYAEPTVTAIGQKLGSTFRPSTDEGYTTPFILNHYDTPGNQPEYAEPLPPEPEYATPFSEQPFESKLTTLMGILHGSTHGPPVPAPGARTTSSHARYDCPSHRVLSNGYCTPALHGSGPRPVSLVYAEPKSCDSLLQNHTYEEPL
ncbi:hypothetical protein F2P81_001791 [Scophthalmus maximus]|uniref:Uncharacterized protein n=1 Tax=Scophthalmus maximus TaxID=52904 RepID=A0A6A4TT76_SCOMX|nr:hypothetical protein F2P81_001791 [Scophthalmus maximus]